MDYPVDYLSNMKKLLGEDYELFAKALDNKYESGIRINESKISVEEFEQITPFPITKVPFVSNGFYIDDADAWSKHPYYFAGLYYIQEPSAMLPASRLPIDEGDIVLDLCAAPGGKSTMLSTGPIKALVSNDISFSRTIPLVKNLEIFGSCRSCVTCESPEKLSRKYEEFFDKILVDAPCSGEGMFRKDPGLIKSYLDKGPDYYHPIQKEILNYAVMMLKPGGMLMYSTCTFSNYEDEQVILDILKEHSELKVVGISKTEYFDGPYKMYSGANEITDVIHVFPHRVKGEGHFMCLLSKDTESKPASKSATEYCLNKIIKDYSELPEEARSFLNLYSDVEIFETRKYLLENDGNIYILPEGFEQVLKENIHYLRTGVILGNINRKGHFVPHTALALANEFKEFNNILDLKSNDVNTVKYLKGETLIPDKECGYEEKLSKGFVLICTDGFPLGFAKYDGTRLKNLYEKGWIYR